MVPGNRKTKRDLDIDIDIEIEIEIDRGCPSRQPTGHQHIRQSFYSFRSY
jgi:hypothetical protein